MISAGLKIRPAKKSKFNKRMPPIGNFKKPGFSLRIRQPILPSMRLRPCLKPESPETLEKLELLDDLVYDAISGRSGALEQLQTVWPR